MVRTWSAYPRGELKRPGNYKIIKRKLFVALLEKEEKEFLRKISKCKTLLGANLVKKDFERAVWDKTKE